MTKIEEIAASKNLSLNSKKIDSSLEIFEELDLLKYNNDKVKFVNNSRQELDLSDSIRYNKIIKTIKDFNYFSNLAFSNNLFKLIQKLKTDYRK